MTVATAHAKAMRKEAAAHKAHQATMTLPFALPAPEPVSQAGQLADELGQVKAQIADLKRHEEKLKDQLKKLLKGQGEAEGALFRATVSTFPTTNVDWRAIAERMEPSPQLVAAYTEHGEQTNVKVVARKAS